MTAIGGPLAYQWHKDGVPIPGANGPNFTLDPVQSADTGQYAVTVSNACGSIWSDLADLELVEPPRTTRASLSTAGGEAYWECGGA